MTKQATTPAEAVIGQAIDRVDGRLKVTGRAKYASEFPVEGLVYAQGVNSTIAKGDITRIDTAAAEAQPGVIRVITHENALKLASPDADRLELSTTSIAPVLQSPEINWYGEWVAVVVAETIEQAQYAARLVEVEYNRAEPKVDFAQDAGYAPDVQPKYERGDVDAGMAEADERVEVTYRTPVEHHHPMELHAVIAEWEDENLELHLCSQMVNDNAKGIADTFMIPKENVRIIAPFIGGGFGSKLQAQEHVMLAAMAAKMIGRPVQFTVTRQQMFTNTSLRQENLQRMRIGATRDGRLTALVHDTTSHTATNKEYQEPCGAASKMLYKVANNRVNYNLVPINLPYPWAMRAPGEATGSYALECAMDEMAWKLGMDPVEFRILNDTQVDPSNDKPFSSRLLTECLRIGAKKFGWADRPLEPRSRREGNWLVGYGVSAASRQAPLQLSAARVTVYRDGDTVTATVQTDATDIGTGTYTILAQTAADFLGIPVAAVTVQLGDSRFPISPGSGGSWGAASFTNGVRAACMKLMEEIKVAAGTDATEGQGIADLMDDADLSEYAAVGSAAPTEEFKNHSVYSFGANFCEVWVDVDTNMARLKRILTVGAAGTILNPKTAYSQVLGGLVMGHGMAFMEQSKVEKQYGNFITRSLADYHVPVNLDLADVQVVFLPEDDKIANPMGVKGIGELGICGVAGSLANAVFNATGKRMRDLPITPEKLITTKIEPGVTVSR
ncbi:xanthine dehydrogenase molybdenum binding subunit apoprotein [Neolewinella xylanilytica]|uniref:Xanthine dehydrogenase molybdenum binding subunit apoprotein n=1 Tax=Neolewinella xylanilytica TaxID=1514080 RepID=A0A2S6I032_9BACT|nr:xanthine dehydrogenase family protein molybdopterin-binding subunit [Neolewinella xylanilytica]PPK84223.1 xanthine dehydrogenase molybdenum binding subunit apoprotein [Neolewinella xylanilytica]